MEQEDSISFTSVLASLLLLKRCVTPTFIVNFISRLSCEDIEVNDIEDGMNELLRYVCIDIHYSYLLKENLNYDTILYDNITVHEFLESYVDKRVLNLIQKDSTYFALYQENCPKKELETKLFPNLSFEREESGKKIDFLKRVRKNSVRRLGYSFFGKMH